MLNYQREIPENLKPECMAKSNQKIMWGQEKVQGPFFCRPSGCSPPWIFLAFHRTQSLCDGTISWGFYWGFSGIKLDIVGIPETIEK